MLLVGVARPASSKNELITPSVVDPEADWFRSSLYQIASANGLFGRHALDTNRHATANPVGTYANKNATRACLQKQSPCLNPFCAKSCPEQKSPPTNRPAGFRSQATQRPYSAASAGFRANIEFHLPALSYTHGHGIELQGADIGHARLQGHGHHLAGRTASGRQVSSISCSSTSSSGDQKSSMVPT